MSVVIQRGLRASLLGGEVIGESVARLSCECQVWVGRRVDNELIASVADPCSVAHRKTIIARFNERMATIIPSKSTEPLIDVVARILMDCA